MTPTQLEQSLNQLISNGEQTPIMIEGPPGIGKSSVVYQVADRLGLDVIDLRLGQIPPSDIRGLPMVEDGISKYARPEWLPESGSGILFLDELTNAAPTVQGLAQQLLLDRCVGEHKLGDGWFVVAAGNAREHGAATHGMPTPVANRMFHFALEAEFSSWKTYAIGQSLHEDVVGFLSFRPELLFKLERRALAFPTPRSWEGASRLHGLGMPVDAAVGEPVAAEFRVYCEVVGSLPDINLVLDGEGADVDFPAEVSARYAVCVGLALRVKDEVQALAVFHWLNEHAGPEWIQMFIADAMLTLSRENRQGQFAALAAQEPALSRFVEETLSVIYA
jgi:hypothetical protein